MDQRLSQLVEDLTTSGEPQLDPQKMKELKKICRSSDEHICHIYHLLMTQLNEDHAQIRLSAFQIVDELFTRSHQFRTLIISNFQELLELTVETDYDQPLPPPEEVAQNLKTTAIKSVQRWHEEYGEAYKKLSLGYHFLKQNKKVDFRNVSARTLTERKRVEEKQKRLDSIYGEKAKKAEKEMDDMSMEIQTTLVELENCFRLLMPDPFEFIAKDTETVDWRMMEVDKTISSSSVQKMPMFDEDQPCCSKNLPSISFVPKIDSGDLNKEMQKNISTEDCLDSRLTSVHASEDDDHATFVRSHGLGSHKYTLSLEIPTDVKLHENEDNTAIINNIKDFQKLIQNKFLPSVQSWIQLFTRAGINDSRLRQAIDLKQNLEIAMEKNKDINIEFEERKKKVMSIFNLVDFEENNSRTVQSFDKDKWPAGSDQKTHLVLHAVFHNSQPAVKATEDDDEDDDNDDDFVEVPEKEGYDPCIPDLLRKEYGLEPVIPPKPLATGKGKKTSIPSSQLQLKRSEEECDPTCAAATWKIIQDKLPKMQAADGCITQDINSEPAASGKRGNTCEEEKAKAPFVPFGLDLFYWGQEQPQSSSKILKFSSQHRFWAPNEVEEEVENKEIAELLKSRYITFAGKFEPVKHKCQAPMPNGRLCERQDRFKCPFHGKIIPRNESGIPINEEDRVKEAKKEFEKREKHPEWQDPEFMREVEASAGVDLGSSRYSGKGKGGKTKGKKKKYPKLVDLKQQANTCRSRLEKKVFNKASVKRVVKAMNRMDQRKHEKFANQFNYALN